MEPMPTTSTEASYVYDIDDDDEWWNVCDGAFEIYVLPLVFWCFVYLDDFLN
jgi:hypothetical protein